ncbi:MAG: ATP-dependent RNA helicase RhlE [Saprospiraceae bacterium]|jgi:ATP-dependent RNA helicase RhlE
MSELTKFSDLNLNTPLLNALQDMGLEYPTPIQEQAFSIIMSGRDVIGTAQTGTGKTYAYLLPILRRWTFTKSRDPRVLIIVPTRELVIQVTAEIEKLTEYMNTRVSAVYGGTNINTQKIDILQGQDIVVATPGRLVDLALHGALKLKMAKTLVIDEVDEMLNLGFLPQLVTLLDLMSDKRQNLLFSATMTDEVKDLIEDFFNGPVHIAAAAVSMPAEKIEMYLYHVPNFNTKVNLLIELFESDSSMEKVLVFTRNKRHADKLHEMMTFQYPEKIGVIHSNKSQNLRIRTVKKFKEGAYRALIATDIIARGLDVEGITHVINFELSEVPENYVHRVGRTARADASGIALSFVAEKELPYMESIETLILQKIEVREMPSNVEISSELIPDEIEKLGGDKDYLGAKRKTSKGAFHDKKEKNMKVNRAQEKRMARKLEKKKSKRKKKRD